MTTDRQHPQDPVVRSRAVVWDVVLGWVVGMMLAGTLAFQISDLFGWDPTTPAGMGGSVGRAVTEAATGQSISDPPVPFPATALFQLPFWLALVTIPLLIAKYFGRNIKEDFGLAFKVIDIPVGLVCGLLSQFALVPLIYLPLRGVIDMDQVDDEAVRLGMTALSSRGGALALVLLVTVGAPLVEEFAYRGGIQRALAGRMPAWAAIGLASLIFGLTHFQLVQLPALVAIGVVAGILAHRADRLGPAIWAHAGFNGAAAAALLL